MKYAQQLIFRTVSADCDAELVKVTCSMCERQLLRSQADNHALGHNREIYTILTTTPKDVS